jgi:hypothetical protein
MHNLLHNPLRVYELERLLTTATRGPVLPPMGAPQWRQVAARPAVARWLEQIREAARKEAAEPIPELTPDLYAEYHRSGFRLGFERLYFDRRSRLARAAVAYLMASSQSGPEKEAFRNSFLQKLGAIVDETSWALPAHVKEPSGKDPHQIDLFAAETANLMAELIVVFGNSIPQELTRRMKLRVRQIHHDYLDPKRNYTWLTATGNWNAVCHQGVLGSALLIEDDDAFVARLLDRALQFLPYFVNGFTRDGGCSEGPGYWEYGFGWFALLNEQLEARSGDSFTLLGEDPLLRSVALYGPRVSLAGGRLVNFSDCRPQGRLRPSLLQYLGQRLDEPSLLHLARENYRPLAEHGLQLDYPRSDFLFFLRLFLYCPENLASSAENSAAPADVFFNELEVVVARGTTGAGASVEFAAKGGNNAEHHNHNDCGSYILHCAGQPIVMEIGAPEYNKAFFGPDRYQNLAARGRGHSIPVINSCEQAPGKEYRSAVLTAELSETGIDFSLDLTHCYPTEADCQNCRRDFSFDKRTGALDVSDHFELTRCDSLESALIIDCPVEEHGQELLLGPPPHRYRLILGAGTRLLGMETCAYSNHVGEPAEVRRITLGPEAPALSVVLSYSLQPEP